MPAPTLRIPVALNLDTFKKSVSDAKTVTSDATKFIVKQFIDMNASVLATSGATGAAVLGFRSLLGAMTLVGGAATAIVASFKLMAYATDLAKEKIDEFNQIAEKSAQAGVSTDFFQRFVKSGETLKLTIDEATEALDNFAKKSQEALGGSQLQQRIDQLVQAGNFQGNSGVGAFAGASDTQSRLTAIVSLIDQALQSGQRLAALDLSQRAFGDVVTNNLRADSGYLDQMLATAQQFDKNKIISADQINDAVDLKARLEDAQKVLADKFKPVQDDLAQLGINYQRSWVEIYETLAKAVSLANDLYSGLKGIPDVLASAGNSSFWKQLTDATGKLGLNSEPTGLFQFGALDDARAKVNNQLQNPANVRASQAQVTAIQSAVLGDTSKAPAKAANDTADAYDRATESVTKHTGRLEADAQAAGFGAGAQEQLRVEAQLTAAAQQAGIPIDAARTAQIKALAQAAADAAAALAKARVDSNIQFGSRTALLSPEDVQIAQQLRQIYGNDVPAALASSQASAIRFNNTLSDISNSISTNLTTSLTDIVDGTKSAGDAFKSFGTAVVQAIDQAIIKLLIVQPLMRALQSSFGLGSLFGFSSGGSVNVVGAAGSTPVPTFAGGGHISGSGSGRSDSILARVSNGEYIVNADAAARHRQLLDIINFAPKFADGGAVSSLVPAMPTSAQSNSLSVTVVQNNDFSSGITGNDQAWINSRLQQTKQETVAATIGAIRSGNKSDSRFLG